MAGRLAELAVALDGASGAGAAAGDAALAGALRAFVANWGSSLATMAGSVDGLAANLGAASSAYVGTDDAAMPGG